MMDLREAARAVDGALHGEPRRFHGVTTDSRSVSDGDLFVALKGERFDGHEYLGEAQRRGAVAALTSRRVDTQPPMPQVVAGDTRLALGRLAAHWRSRFALPLAALTGSNGKTTVKEMLTSILEAHFGHRSDVLATEGNLNNDIGMPITLLRLREHHHCAVIEMGMNHEGEIDYLTRIAQPTVAIVNNAQRAHVGLLGSIEAIARAKGEIYAGLHPSGVAVVNEDDAFAGYWKGLNREHRVVTFGFASSALVRGRFEGSELRVQVPSGAFSVALQVSGEHNARNALAACAAAFALEVPVHSMREGLSAFRGVPGRLQRRRGHGGGTVIDDSYNANPESMKAAIRVLAQEPAPRVLVMGDMGELGAGSDALHAEVGTFAREAGIDALLGLGAGTRHAVAAFGARGTAFDDIEALIAAARAASGDGGTVLVKGSRFMRMERVADALAPGGERHAA
ncbi:MAG TPA: UDP-N-acetylmuramoyl-tripeptide--D-alanyl-D-alanine ligase [Usitatibacter sp.]|nr:UDP-N-acetylmuramoyl-tripeptide--D-alanyl-D-alanine ligase [Usitatibacter sp.]